MRLLNKKKQILPIISLLISIIIFTIYLPSLKNNFVLWDDDIYVYENPVIQSINLKSLKRMFTTEINHVWHPLTLLSFAFDYSIWGLNSFGYHLTNAVIHALNTVIVFMLVIALIKCEEHAPPVNGCKINNGVFVAFVTAFLFGIHPLHVESVAWISERKDVLYALFYLLSILAYIRYISILSSQKYLYYGSCLFFFIMSLMSKPMAVSLPLVLLILDFYPLNRLPMEVKEIKKRIIEKTPFFLLSSVISIVIIWRYLSTASILNEKTLSPAANLFIALQGYLFYLIKIVFPINLAPLYPRPYKVYPFNIEYISSLIILSIITHLCVRIVNKNKLFLAIWLYYIITLIPVVGAFGRHSMADRFTYLPGLGPFILIGLGLRNSLTYSKKGHLRTLIVMLLLCSAILGILAIKQISVWRDSVTFWSYEIKHYPNVFIAYYNRGVAYNSIGRYKEALQDYERAIELKHPYKKEVANAYFNRGNVHMVLRNHRQALDDFSKAIDLYPLKAGFYVNRGNVYSDLGNSQQAIADLTVAISIDPFNADAYHNRGTFYSASGDYQRAIIDYSKAIELNPRFSDTYYLRGIAYDNLGDLLHSGMDYRKAASLGLKEAQDHLLQQGK